MDKIDATLVRDGSGRIALQDTIALFHNELNVFLSNEQADTDRIANGVTEFWDGHPGLKSASLDSIASAVFGQLNAPPESFKELTARIKSYIRSNTNTFYVGRGKSGGVNLLSRMTTEERAKADAIRARAAAKLSA